ELSFEALCESLVPIYSKAADLNRGINNMRFGLLHRANLAIFFTYITLGVSSASYAYHRLCGAEESLDSVRVTGTPRASRPLKVDGSRAKLKKDSKAH